MNNKIDKNIFLKACKCSKATFLELFRPNLKADNPHLDFVIRRSHKVEELARKLFPKGTNVSHKSCNTFEDYVKYTNYLLLANKEVLYKPHFQSSSGKCKCDILVTGGKKWKLYEVKCSTRIEDKHILDIAYQLKIIKECFPDIKLQTYIIHLNKDYIREEDLIPEELFKVVEITTRTRLAQSLVEKYLNVIDKVITTGKEPNIAIGSHCNKYFQCEFKKHCWKDIPDNSVFDISRMWEFKKFQLHEQGIVKLEDIPRKVKLNENQWMQIDCHVQKRHVIDSNSIEEFLKDVQFPIYFMDFGSITSAIPLYRDTSVYAHIPFQFSVHCLQYNGDLSHNEFLHCNIIEDPRISFIEALLESVGNEGTVLVYNKKIVEARLKEIMNVFPQYERRVRNLINRIKDLMIPFDQRYLYHPEQRGSSSIKNVLSAWVEDLSYNGLAISNGTSANDEYEKLTFENVPKRTKEKIKKDLLEYCKMNTYGMVRILYVLKNIVLENKQAA